jgi:hypothetical protein
MLTPIRTSKHLTSIPQAQLHTWDSAELSAVMRSLMFMSRPQPPPPPSPAGEKQE